MQFPSILILSRSININIYTNNYRKNLVTYWRQYYPKWNIPKGYHVHHIKPRCIGGTNEPKNLIALHPDDHVSIHKNRGDYWANDKFLNVLGNAMSDKQRAKQSILCSKLNKKYKTKPKETRIFTCSYCGELIIKLEFKHHKRKQHYYCDYTCKNRYVWFIKFPKRKRKPYKKSKNKRIAWNKGLKNPQAAENGKRGALKQSKTVTGRKRVIRDGHLRWAYPNDHDYPNT